MKRKVSNGRSWCEHAAARARRGDAGPIVVDSAGAHYGGARRLLESLDAYLDGEVGARIRMIGRGRSLTSAWMARREVITSRCQRTVAFNNVIFLAAGTTRTVLLRNALHFVSAAEARSLGIALSSSVLLESKVIALTSRRADIVVVPTSRMAERVLAALPWLRDRLVVRPEPISPRENEGPRQPWTFLCPLMFADYKRMADRLRIIAEGCDKIASDPGDSGELKILLTASPEEVGDPILAAHPRFRFLGRLTTKEVDDLASRCWGILFPTEVESFGYPLAEARVNRQPVIAIDNGQSLELAGDALVGSTSGNSDTVAAVLLTAGRLTLPPAQVTDFDPRTFFDWLLTGDPR